MTSRSSIRLNNQSEGKENASNIPAYYGFRDRCVDYLLGANGACIFFGAAFAFRNIHAPR